MTSVDDFTPLESLLLFQSLRAHGTSSDAFDKISDSLRRSSLLQNDTSTSAERFSPDSLKSVYLALLKDEAKRDLQAALERQSPQPNGDGGSQSRKRKAPSPSLPTVEEAAQHAHLVPRLIGKLYSQYRDQVVNQIRGKEKQFDEVVGEIDGLEVAKDVDDAESRGTKLPDGKHETEAQIESLPTNDARETNGVDEDEQMISKSIESTEKLNEAPELAVRTSSAFKVGDLKDSAESNESITQTHSQDSKELVSTGSMKQRGPEGTSTAPTRHRLDPIVPPHADGPENRQSSADAQTSTEGPSTGGAVLASSPSTSIHGTSMHPNSSSVLSPSPGMQSQSPSTTQWPPRDTTGVPSQASPTHVSPTRVAPSDQQRRPSLPLSDRDKPQLAPSGGPLDIAPTPQAPYLQPYGGWPQQPNSPYQQSSPTSTTQSSNRGQGGVMLPPFQVSPQVPSGSHPGQLPKLATSAARSPSRQGVDSGGQLTSGVPTNDGRVPYDQSTPLRPDHSHLNRADVTISPGSNTVWRILPESKSEQAEQAPPRDVSPISDPEDSGEVPQSKSSRRGREGDIRATRPPRRGGRTPQATSRSPSVAVSSAADQTRSQSVASPIDESSATSVAQKDHVKMESNADADDVDELSLPGKHTRRSAVPSKRKQSDQDVDDPPSSATHPKVIVAYRNFQKMTAPLLNTIQSHKHGSLFQNPVKDVNAPGYSDIVYQPQDIKSIRAAISAGSRAVAATDAAAAHGSPGGATTGAGASATLTLPYSEELVPPRAIVNGAQLEQEMMRMFANAAMFNPGTEDVVRDTREMFEVVEQSISAWRSAERDEPVDDDGGDDARGGGGTPVAASASKRRRL